MARETELLPLMRSDTYMLRQVALSGMVGY